MPLDLLIGTSHTVIYMRGHQLAAERGEAPSDLYRFRLDDERYKPLMSFTPAGPLYHPQVYVDLGNRIAELRPDCIVTAVLGAEAWIRGMSHEDPPYDFHVPELPQHPASPDLEQIPYDLLLKNCYGDLGWQFDLVVGAIRRFTDLPIFHIEAPPPARRAELMLRDVRQNAWTIERMERSGVPSVAQRFKIWWMWTAMARRLCEENGLHFLAGPPQTRDPDGFLNEAYFGDGVHANNEYGALMVQEVAKARQRLLTGIAAHV